MGLHILKTIVSLTSFLVLKSSCYRGFMNFGFSGDSFAFAFLLFYGSRPVIVSYICWLRAT
jgi:hypothetical protein